MKYSKAYIAAVTSFLGFAAARAVPLPWWVEGALLASVAAAGVWWVPNRDDSETVGELDRRGLRGYIWP